MKTMIMHGVYGMSAITALTAQNTTGVRAIQELLPISTVVTPNIPEAQILSGLTIKTKEDMVTAAKKIGDDYHCAVLLKGGHRINDANDLLYTNAEFIWFEGKRIDNPNNHSTGCTLSSAIASNLAKGFTLDESRIFIEQT